MVLLKINLRKIEKIIYKNFIKMDPQTPIKTKNVICPDAPKKNYHKRIARTLFVITKNLTDDFRGVS